MQSPRRRPWKPGHWIEPQRERGGGAQAMLRRVQRLRQQSINQCTHLAGSSVLPSPAAAVGGGPVRCWW